MFSSEELLRIRERIEKRIEYSIKLENNCINLYYNLDLISYNGFFTVGELISNEALVNVDSCNINKSVKNLVVGGILANTPILEKFIKMERREKNLKKILD